MLNFNFKYIKIAVQGTLGAMGHQAEQIYGLSIGGETQVVIKARLLAHTR